MGNGETLTDQEFKARFPIEPKKILPKGGSPDKTKAWMKGENTGQTTKQNSFRQKYILA